MNSADPGAPGNGMRGDPGGHFLERNRGNRLFDAGVFTGCAGLRGLEKMIQRGKLGDLEILVAAGYEGFADGRQIQFRRHLQVLSPLIARTGHFNLLSAGAGS